jgi:methionyl-tRNA formyltransferase
VRLVYFGTPAMAVPPLRALHAAGHQIVRVVSRPDTRRGRGSSNSPSPVKAAALELGLDVVDDPRDVLAVEADLGVVVAYGRIISTELLAHLRMVNLHFSLLPRWRGAAPVERAILAGDEVTGVCVMAVEEGLDTGAVYARAEVPVPASLDADELRTELVQVGTELLVDCLARGLGEGVPQTDEGVSYAKKLSTADLELHWDRPVLELRRIIGVGGAWTSFRGRRLKVLAATPEDGAADPTTLPGELVGPTTVRAGDGLLRLGRVQPEGKPAMDADAWANGARPVGERLGT